MSDENEIFETLLNNSKDSLKYRPRNLKTSNKQHIAYEQDNEFKQHITYEQDNEFKQDNNIEDLLIKTLLKFIGKTDPDKDYIGPVEQKSLLNYLIIVFIITIFFYAFLFILTFIQLFIPLFSLEISLTLVIILYFVSQVIFYILEFIILYTRILSAITLIILLAIYGSIVFLLANNLNVFSIIVTNLSILVFYALIILIIFIVGVQLEQLKRFSPKFDANTFICVGLFLVICFEFIANYKSFLFWMYLPICFCLYFQYSSEVVELYRGVSGPYKGLYTIEGVMTLTNMIYGQYVMIMLLFYIVKWYGLIIFFPIPPFFYVLPKEWFTWL